LSPPLRVRDGGNAGKDTNNQINNAGSPVWKAAFLFRETDIETYRPTGRLAHV